MNVHFTDHFAQAHIDPTGQTLRLLTQTFGPDAMTGQPSLVASSILVVPVGEIDNLLELLQNAKSILQPKEETPHERQQNPETESEGRPYNGPH